MFTKKEGFGEVAYPVPYDQPFYMILNLAVGGTKISDRHGVVIDNITLEETEPQPGE